MCAYSTTLGTDLAVKSLFDILELSLSTAQKKNTDFAEVFSALCRFRFT